MILADSTLREIADRIPLQKAELLDIVGMTERKYTKYGAKILTITAPFANERHIASTPRSQGSKSHHQTYEYLQAGKSIEEIASIRNLSPTTIENHLIQCHNDGYKINWDQFIPENYRELMIETIRKLGATKLKPIKQALPDDITYLQIKAVIAQLQLENEQIQNSLPK